MGPSGNGTGNPTSQVEASLRKPHCWLWLYFLNYCPKLGCFGHSLITFIMNVLKSAVQSADITWYSNDLSNCSSHLSSLFIFIQFNLQRERERERRSHAWKMSQPFLFACQLCRQLTLAGKGFRKFISVAHYRKKSFSFSSSSFFMTDADRDNSNEKNS